MGFTSVAINTAAAIRITGSNNNIHEPPMFESGFVVGPTIDTIVTFVIIVVVDDIVIVGIANSVIGPLLLFLIIIILGDGQC